MRGKREGVKTGMDHVTLSLVTGMIGVDSVSLGSLHGEGDPWVTRMGRVAKMST